MKDFLFIVATLAVLLTSCKKPDTPQGGDTPAPVYPRYEIGDHFRNDTLEGIVFFTIAGGSSGLMVSLEETQLPWCTTSNINCLTGATNPYDGWNNTNIVMANYDLRHFPAIRWSHVRNTWHLQYYSYRPVTAKQWYVPASNELRYLLANQEAVNLTLQSLGYPTLEDKTYWSSTETGTRGAAAVRMQNGEVVISDSLKTQHFYVRAIRNF